MRQDFSVDEPATAALRESMARIHSDEQPGGQNNQQPHTAAALTNGSKQGGASVGYNRGGTISELLASCRQDTGLEPPRPQWERDPYGPHTGLPYVREWYKRMREGGMGVWDGI